MKYIYLSLLGILLVLLLFWQGQAEDLRLVQGEVLTYTGEPLAHQPLLIEGRKETSWLNFFRLRTSTDKVKVLLFTDERGFIQVVDLPAGHYTLKLLQSGKVPVTLKEFKLTRPYKTFDVSTKIPIKESLKVKELLDIDVSKGLKLEERK